MELYGLFFSIEKVEFIKSTLVEEVRAESWIGGDSDAECKDAINADLDNSSSVCDTEQKRDSPTATKNCVEKPNFHIIFCNQLNN
jgi:hypothetical protein